MYFLQEVENGRFEVYFGDDVVSKALSDGNVVYYKYVVTNKSALMVHHHFLHHLVLMVVQSLQQLLRVHLVVQNQRVLIQLNYRSTS